MAERPAEDRSEGDGPSRGTRMLLAGAGIGALLGLGLGWSIGRGPVSARTGAADACDCAAATGHGSASSTPTGLSGEAALGAKLDDARRLMTDRAWVTPPERNVRAALAELRQRWPSDPRVADTVSEAAERALADALGLEVAGRRDVAASRVRLALEWEPELPGARELLARLEHTSASAAADGLELGPLPTRLPGRSTGAPPEQLAPAPPPGQGGP